MSRVVLKPLSIRSAKKASVRDIPGRLRSERVLMVAGRSSWISRLVGCCLENRFAAFHFTTVGPIFSIPFWSVFWKPSV